MLSIPSSPNPYLPQSEQLLEIWPGTHGWEEESRVQSRCGDSGSHGCTARTV